MRKSFAVPVWYRDVIAGAVLFVATAAVVVWQNSRIGVLWDLSFVLEQAYRISLGQVPYRDFPLAYPPLAYVMQAALIKVTGTAFWHHVLYAAAVSGLATVLTWRILLNILRGSIGQPRLVAFLLSAPLAVLGIYCIWPDPSYDGDCTFAILAAILLLFYAEEKGFPVRLSFLAGIAVVVPAFVKQNTGLAFLGSTVLALLALLVIDRRRAGVARGYGAILCGVAAGLALAALLIQVSAGLGNYLHWTVQFAAGRHMGSMWAPWAVGLLPWWLAAFVAGAIVLAVRPTTRFAAILAMLLFSVPFVWTSACLLTRVDARDAAECLLSLWPFLLIVSFVISVLAVRQRKGVALIVPFITIGTLQGAFLSQGVWGSTYAVWPLAMILIASALAAAANWTKHGSAAATTISLAIALSLLISGGHYVRSLVRLDYADIWNGQPERSAVPALRGLTVRGAWLHQFDELVAYAKEKIPAEDGLILIPGEDLFYYATGREPRFPVLMFDETGNPYSPDQIAQRARTHNIKWLVVKRKLQLQFDVVEDRQHLLGLLGRGCTKADELENYDVYRCLFAPE
jgi:4-amino-4-deoxy-L-arabinose transferase-like glycosyltransferase